jgi:hypothetical protein
MAPANSAKASSRGPTGSALQYPEAIKPARTAAPRMYFTFNKVLRHGSLRKHNLDERQGRLHQRRRRDLIQVLPLSQISMLLFSANPVYWACELC